MGTNSFYDDLTPLYHLIYADWEASRQRQAEQLEAIIAQEWGQEWGPGLRQVLDVACGIGTQALGLAERGFEVTASDLSPRSVERARQEARQRGLAIDFSVADLRQAYDHHARTFDLVLACDNAIPHLLSEAEILAAFRQLYACIRPGGGLLISVRDYDQEERGGTQVKPYGVRQENGRRYLIFQVWDYDGDQYQVSLYFVEDDLPGGPLGESPTGPCRTRVLRTRYFAIGTGRLLALMQAAGFVAVKRLDGVFFQPVLVGKKAG